MTKTTTLCIVMCVGTDKYAVPCQRVVEVVPSVPLARLVMAPAWMAGVFTYRGRVTPVVDLGVLLAGTPCTVRLSSRIVVVAWNGTARTLGLLTSRVSSTLQLDLGPASGLSVGITPALARSVRYDGELLHVLDVDALVPASALAADERAEPAP